MRAEEAAHELLRIYRARGLSGKELRCAVARHVNILRPLDPAVAEALEGLPLRDGGRIPTTIAESEWGS